MTENLANWADNYTYTAARLHRPTVVEQVSELVAKCSRAKALGSRHSFNEIADTPEDLISLEYLNRIVALDRERMTVTVEGGVRYGELCKYLNEEGFAIHNLASLPHISVVGACATATHGSGEKNGNLATAICNLQIVKADGSVVALSRDHKDFYGAVVGLGGVGIVTQITMDIVPAFQMTQQVFEDLPLESLEAHFDEIEAGGYSVSLFTHWERPLVDQVWVKRKFPHHQAESHFFGAVAATTNLHPIKNISPINCTEQMGVPGPWHERMPHFRMEYTPSSGEELQSEYLIPRQHILHAIHAVYEMRAQIAPHLQISEIRTIAADELWMSPCYKQPCVGIHFTWKKDWDSVRKVLPLLERQLEPFQARPHWGKLFVTCPKHLYQQLEDFQRLLHSYDPQGKFRNAFFEKHIFGDQHAAQQ